MSRRGREGFPLTDCHDAAFLFVQFRSGDNFKDGMVDEARVLVGRYFAQVRFNVLLHLLGRLLAHIVVTAFQARNERLQHRGERMCDRLAGGGSLSSWIPMPQLSLRKTAKSMARQAFQKSIFWVRSTIGSTFG